MSTIQHIIDHGLCLQGTEHICVGKPLSLHSIGPIHSALGKVLGSSAMPRISLEMYCLAQTKIMPATTLKVSAACVNNLSNNNK